LPAPLIRLDDQGALYTALEQLHPSLREVLLLCDVEEIKYKDIAAIFDVPIGTVMSRFSHARSTLRQLLQSQLGITLTQTPETNESTEHLNAGKLNAFIDGELPPAERQGIEEHLTGCHACTVHVLSATQLKAVGHRFAPPPEALGRLTTQLHSQPQTETRQRRSGASTQRHLSAR
jgi:predicted DNA-binding protein (UPF0251 family)